MGDLGDVLTDTGGFQLFILRDCSLSFFAGRSLLILADETDRLVIVVHEGKAFRLLHDFLQRGLRDFGLRRLSGLVCGFGGDCGICAAAPRLSDAELFQAVADTDDQEHQYKRHENKGKESRTSSAAAPSAGIEIPVIGS